MGMVGEFVGGTYSGGDLAKAGREGQKRENGLHSCLADQYTDVYIYVCV